MSAEDLDAAFDEMDSTGDGRVTVEEFEKWWNGTGGDLHEKMHKEFTMGKDIESIREMGTGAMLG
jgi:Ca2+-binding EF-hand superfamily protein